MNNIRYVFKIYREALHTYPLSMQAVQASILMGAGDMIAQTAIERKSFRELDKRRLFGFAGLGLCFVGPTVRLWYGVLDRTFPVGTTGFAYKKVLLDQLLFAPAFIAALVSMINVVSGSSLEEVGDKLQQDYKDILITNYKLWPAVQIINFSFVPLAYQVLVVQFVAVMWNTYLSWKTNQPILHHKALGS